MLKQLNFLFLLLSAIFQVELNAQDKAKFDQKLYAYEDSLQKIAIQIRDGETERERAEACFAFIPTLVKALEIPGSFEFPFRNL